MARVALITGASRGIGAATASVLAKHGYRVVVNHRASAPLAEEVVASVLGTDQCEGSAFHHTSAR
jgi:3-oxoacyl-[acyl-carrier protein] reductase